MSETAAMGILERWLTNILPECIGQAKCDLRTYEAEIGKRFCNKDRFRQFLVEYKIQRIRGFSADEFYNIVYDRQIDDLLRALQNCEPSECINKFIAVLCRPNMAEPDGDYSSFASKILFVSLPEWIPIYDRYAFAGFQILWRMIFQKPDPECKDAWRKAFFDKFKVLMGECDDRLIAGELSTQSNNNLILKIKAFDRMLMALGKHF